MLGPICAMLLGQLCVPAELVDVSAMVGGIVQVLPDGSRRPINPARVLLEGVYVQVNSVDDFRRLPASDLRESCSDNACVVFRRLCTPDLATCAYQVGFMYGRDSKPGATLDHYIIQAIDRRHREAAEARLMVVDPEHASAASVPLSALARSKPARSGAYFGPPGLSEGALDDAQH